ncbi:hypothetical protein FHG87_016715 [Trinorchestia longiramus]|nr:hypothetical protein FHG87_016715 [Trinorchestia longiramus]
MVIHQPTIAAADLEPVSSRIASGFAHQSTKLVVYKHQADGSRPSWWFTSTKLMVADQAGGTSLHTGNKNREKEENVGRRAVVQLCVQLAKTGRWREDRGERREYEQQRHRPQSPVSSQLLYLHKRRIKRPRHEQLLDRPSIKRGGGSTENGGVAAAAAAAATAPPPPGSLPAFFFTLSQSDQNTGQELFPCCDTERADTGPHRETGPMHCTKYKE